MARLARRIADQLQRALGVMLFREGARYIWPEEDFLRRLFAQLRPDCVLDVGANTGQYALELRRSGFTGTIVSFEPNPRAFAGLQAAASQDPRWHCYRVALGAQKAQSGLNVMAHDLLSSFHTIRQDEGTAFIGGREIAETVTVDVETLDELLPRLQAEHGFANPFLKIDTQGYDLEVLRGGAHVIRSFCGLVSEASILRLYDRSPAIEESLAAFRQAGFYVVGLFNVHPEPRLRQMVECNCYCVRDDLIESS